MINFLRWVVFYPLPPKLFLNSVLICKEFLTLRDLFKSKLRIFVHACQKIFKAYGEFSFFGRKNLHGIQQNIN